MSFSCSCCGKPVEAPTPQDDNAKKVLKMLKEKLSPKKGLVGKRNPDPQYPTQTGKGGQVVQRPTPIPIGSQVRSRGDLRFADGTILLTQETKGWVLERVLPSPHPQWGYKLIVEFDGQPFAHAFYEDELEVIQAPLPCPHDSVVDNALAEDE